MRTALFVAVVLAAQAATPAAVLDPPPATFTGNLPCADCPGIRYHLNLFADHVFFLRMTYQEQSTARRVSTDG